MAGRGRHGRDGSRRRKRALVLGAATTRVVAATNTALTLVSAVSLVRDQPDDGFAPTIKWPNDLLANGKKLAGILAEVQSEGREIKHVVVGIGINVNHTLSDFPRSWLIGPLPYA